ncbi:MAG TPA: DUF6675 family protein [Rectinemataceae bacterium]|nr:DUF6675 family protein [Rectinemataceae bacterium]
MPAAADSSVGAAISAAFTGLSAGEAASLGQGEVVIRSDANYRHLALVAGGSQAEDLRQKIRALSPNYLSEVMAVVPARPGTLERLAASLANVKGFVGIPYWSKRWQKNFDLFDKMDITAAHGDAAGQTIEVIQHMLPFDDFGASYAYTLGADSLLFRSSNTSVIMYGSHEAVQTGQLLWMLYAFRSGDSLVFYGVGGVKAWDFFGLFRGRLEASFSGRVESFMRFMAAKMKD